MRRAGNQNNTKRANPALKVELPKATAKVLSITSVFALALFVSPLLLALLGLVSGLI